MCQIVHVHLSLQADGKVAVEDIPVSGVCGPACHDSSLYLDLCLCDVHLKTHSPTFIG